jgi:thiamine-phosphate pyrophosphorylase
MSDERLRALRGIYPLADDDPQWRHGPETVVAAALAAGARVIQLRLKRSGDAEALASVRHAVALTRRAGALLIVNDRFDLADLGGADGVHLGQDDLSPERVPAEVRRRLIVGFSTHTPEQVEASRRLPVDYIAYGPVFGTRSKQTGYEARGLETLGAAVKRAAHPVVAIGGIDAENIGTLRAAGARAAAVISAIADAPDPIAATRRLAQRFAGEGAD